MAIDKWTEEEEKSLKYLLDRKEAVAHQARLQIRNLLTRHHWDPDDDNMADWLIKHRKDIIDTLSDL
jgi:hypothetical protein